MKFFRVKLALHWQIVIALILACIAAYFVKAQGGMDAVLGMRVVAVCDFVGTMFINALKMIIVPIIASSIVSGMIGIGAEKNFGRMGLKTCFFYLFSTFIAVMVGLLAVNIIQPGTIESEAQKSVMMKHAEKAPVGFEEKLSSHSSADLVNIFIRMIPPNVFAASSDNSQLLGVIFFCLLFGFFVTRLPLKHRRFQVKFWQSFQEVTLNMAELILMFAPVGVFALVTPKFIDFGMELFVPVMSFFLTVLGALGFQMFIVMSIFLVLWRVNPVQHLKAMAPAILTAFSTSSSITTLPITMECMEKTAKVSNRVSSFTLPLGASINMNGTALYECIVVVFVAQFMASMGLLTVEFGITQQIMVVVLALFTSLGVAGIPAASIVAIALIMGVVGLDFQFVGIVLVVDRILDMCRSVVNIYADSVGAVIIGKSEGETQIYATDEEI